MWEAELEMQIDELCNLDPGSIPTEEDVFDIYSWVDSLEFSRPKRNIARDFSDGVLYAEMLAHYLPQIVDTRQYYQALSRKNKQNNWDHLTAKVLPKLGMKVEKSLLSDIMDCKPGSIEKLLYSTRPFIARRNRTVLNYRRCCGVASSMNVHGSEAPKQKKSDENVNNKQQVVSSGVSVFTKSQPVTKQPAPVIRQRSKPVHRRNSPGRKPIDNNGNAMLLKPVCQKTVPNSTDATKEKQNLPKAIKGGGTNGGQATKLRPIETEVWNLDDAVSERQLESVMPEASIYVGNDGPVRHDTSILPPEILMYAPQAVVGSMQEMNTYGLV